MAQYSRRRKFCPFTAGQVSEKEIDFKNTYLLRKFITETSKIVPTRISGVKARYQRQISKEIKRARYVALLPYCDRH